MLDVTPVIVGLGGMQEGLTGRIRKTLVAKGPLGGSGEQVF